MQLKLWPLTLTVEFTPDGGAPDDDGEVYTAADVDSVLQEVADVDGLLANRRTGRMGF